MTSLETRRRLEGFVAMASRHPQTSRLRDLLLEIAGELSDYKIDLTFAHERLPTHLLLIKDLRRLVARSDFVLCVTDGQDPDILFKAGLAFGLRKPLLVVILPETEILPATFMGHFYVELAGDASDRECLKSALATLVGGPKAENGRSAGLARMGCAVGGER